MVYRRGICILPLQRNTISFADTDASIIANNFANTHTYAVTVGLPVPRLRQHTDTYATAVLRNDDFFEPGDDHYSGFGEQRNSFDLSVNHCGFGFGEFYRASECALSRFHA